MAERGFGQQAPAARAAVAPRHLGAGAGLVDEKKAVGIDKVHFSRTITDGQITNPIVVRDGRSRIASLVGALIESGPAAAFRHPAVVRILPLPDEPQQLHSDGNYKDPGKHGTSGDYKDGHPNRQTFFRANLRIREESTVVGGIKSHNLSLVGRMIGGRPSSGELADSFRLFISERRRYNRTSIHPTFLIFFPLVSETLKNARQRLTSHGLEARASLAGGRDRSLPSGATCPRLAMNVLAIDQKFHPASLRSLPRG